MRQLGVVKMWAHFLLNAFVLFAPVSGNFPFKLGASDVTIERNASINYRLPTTLKPLHYDVTVEPFFAPEFTFPGKVSIEVRVVEDTSTVTLHGQNLTFDKANVRIKELNAVQYLVVEDLTYDEETMFYQIMLKETLKAGSDVVIEIAYNGILHSDNDGFYRASYVEDGVVKWFATTQFQANAARKAFPCFDEPALKATFTIHVIRPASYNSISNMKLESTNELGPDRFQDTFEKSVLMSTYLVAFIVSEMTSETLGNEAVYAPKYLIDDGRGLFSVRAGARILKAMEIFTNVPYSLDKMHHVAIPDGYYSAGAMENWGLITYRETRLMYKEGMTTSAEKQSILSIIAHEVSHQWFGNLVGPFWWSYLWLNEGFATYFGWYAVEAIEPSLRMMDQFVVSTVQYAFQTDALESIRPMTFGAETTTEIDGLFDRVAYDKSASVIRMMEHFLTTPIFKQGLTNYLREMEFDAAQSGDLWRGLQAAVDDVRFDGLQGQTVKEIMETWELQAGFPVVTLSRDEDGTITLKEDRFLLEKATHDYNTLWRIPINYATGDDPNFQVTTASLWLNSRILITDQAVDMDHWVILNKQQTGYYRANYDLHNWNLIIDHLNGDDWSKIHVLNRAQLVDDSFNLARSGRLSYDIPLRLSMYLSRESDYIPIASFLTVLSHLNNIVSESDIYNSLFKEYAKQVLRGAYEVVGNEATGEHLDIRNRLNLINWMCKFEDEDCLQAMHDKYVEYGVVEPDLQTAVYCGGLRLDSDSEDKWEYAYKKYHETVEAQERSRWLSALGCSLNKRYLQRVLYMTVDYAADHSIRTGDRSSAFSAVYTSSSIGLDNAFDFLIYDFGLVNQKFTVRQISSLFNGVASRVTSAEKLERLKTFISGQSADVTNVYGSIFNRAVATIESNIEKYATHVTEIEKFLTELFAEPPVTEDPDGGGANPIAISFPLVVGTLLLMLLM